METKFAVKLQLEQDEPMYFALDEPPVIRQQLTEQNGVGKVDSKAKVTIITPTSVERKIISTPQYVSLRYKFTDKGTKINSTIFKNMLDNFN